MKNIKEHDDDRNAPVRSYTTAELMDLYGLTRHAWYTWMKKAKMKEAIGPKDGRHYTPKQVRIIFSKLDPPPAKKPDNQTQQSNN